MLQSYIPQTTCAVRGCYEKPLYKIGFDHHRNREVWVCRKCFNRYIEEAKDKIALVLKAVNGIRVTCDSRWMVWDEAEKSWVVYEKKAYKKKTEIVVRTSEISKAVIVLIGD